MPNSEEFRYVNWRVWRVYKVYGWIELVLLPFWVITDVSWMAEEVFSIPNLNIQWGGSCCICEGYSSEGGICWWGWICPCVISFLLWCVGPWLLWGWTGPHHQCCWASPSIALPLAQLSFSCSALGQYKYSWAAFVHTQATNTCLFSTISYVEIGELRALGVLFVYSQHSENGSWVSQLQGSLCSSPWIHVGWDSRGVQFPHQTPWWPSVHSAEQYRNNHTGSGTEQGQSCSFGWFGFYCALLQVETFPMDQLCLLWALPCPGCCSAPQQAVLSAQAWQAPLVTLTSPAAEGTGKIASEEPMVSFAKPSA